MENPLLVMTNYTYLFVLVMIRYVGLFITTPILSSGAYPNRLKIAIAFFLGVATAPMVAANYQVDYPDHIFLLFGDIIRELGIGLTLGFLVLLVFTSVQLAGKFIDTKMGFAIVNVFDPVFNVSGPITGQFKNILASLLFLMIDGHLIIIEAVYSTFEKIPPGEFIINSQGWQFIFRSMGDIFIIAFMIALPVIGTVFMADVIFGFLARSIPQMNIFIVGLPLKILIGIFILMLSLNLSFYYFSELFTELFQDLSRMIEFFVST